MKSSKIESCCRACAFRKVCEDAKSKRMSCRYFTIPETYTSDISNEDLEHELWLARGQYVEACERWLKIIGFPLMVSVITAVLWLVITYIHTTAVQVILLAILISAAAAAVIYFVRRTVVAIIAVIRGK